MHVAPLPTGCKTQKELEREEGAEEGVREAEAVEEEEAVEGEGVVDAEAVVDDSCRSN